MIHQGEKLRQLRIKLYLSGAEMAKRMGIAQQTLSRAYKQPELARKMIKNVCKTFGVSESYFDEMLNDLTLLNEKEQTYETNQTVNRADRCCRKN